jgi:phospholipase A1
MYKKLILLTLLILFSYGNEDKTIGIYSYKKNYLLPLTYDFVKKDDRNSFETFFQLSIKKPVVDDLFGVIDNLSIAYTQRSFWQTSSKSSPFRETNYYPEVFISSKSQNVSFLKEYKFSLLHHSNGRDGNSSRSWNRIYAQGVIKASDNFSVTPRVWYRIPESADDDDNEDIEDFYGYGDIKFLYSYDTHQFELTLRDNLKPNSNNKGAVIFDWTFGLSTIDSKENLYGFLQIFSGYGESLIDYNRRINKIGIGIALSR